MDFFSRLEKVFFKLSERDIWYFRRLRLEGKREKEDEDFEPIWEELNQLELSFDVFLNF